MSAKLTLIHVLASMGFGADVLRSGSPDYQVGRFVLGSTIPGGTAYTGAPGAPQVIAAAAPLDPRFGRGPAWLIGVAVEHLVALEGVSAPGNAGAITNTVASLSLRLQPAGGDGNPIFSPLAEALTAGPWRTDALDPAADAVRGSQEQPARQMMPLRGGWVWDTADAAALALVYGGGVSPPPTSAAAVQVAHVVYGVLVSKSALAASPREGCGAAPPPVSMEATEVILK